MKLRQATYPRLVRLLWLTMAMLLVVFFGPIKKVIELRSGIENSPQQIDKKLHTCYREKKEIPTLVHVESRLAPDPATILFHSAVLAFHSFFGLKGIVHTPSQTHFAIIVPTLSRYLQLRKIQV